MPMATSIQMNSLCSYQVRSAMGAKQKPNTMQTGQQTAMNNPAIPGFLPSASIQSLG